MRVYDIIGSLFFIGTGLLFVFYSQSLEIGGIEEPGPGFLPFWAGLVLLGMAAVLLLRSFFSRLKEKGSAFSEFFPEQDSWKRVFTVIASLVLYNLIFGPFGFLITTFFFVGFLMKTVFPQNWLRTFITAVMATGGVWIVFVKLLGIQFPKGFFGL
jgi:putative tricarboxylic transport membrane protein